jgi:hypothetical protein
MKVFQVIQVLHVCLERDGCGFNGVGRRGLYLLDKWKPLRYTIRDRMMADRSRL